MDIFAVAVTMLLILDPLGNLPIFVSILRRIPPERRRIVLIRELLFSLIILMVFLFLGEHILSFLSIDQDTVSISGGIILFIIGLRMIFPTNGDITGMPEGQEPFIVPMAIPLIAGPSILAVMILVSQQYPGEMGSLVISVLIAWGITSVVLFSYKFCIRVFGERGLTAMERLMGMMLLMISVQMFINGLKPFLNGTS